MCYVSYPTPRPRFYHSDIIYEDLFCVTSSSSYNFPSLSSPNILPLPHFLIICWLCLYSIMILSCIMMTGQEHTNIRHHVIFKKFMYADFGVLTFLMYFTGPRNGVGRFKWLTSLTFFIPSLTLLTFMK